jgi:hypothetical protein
MDPHANPYTPNAGATPPVAVGRDDQQRSFDLLLARLEKGRTEQSMIITGLRGVGKTVLLREFHKKATARNWAVIDIEVSKHNNDDFRRQLAREFRSALLRMLSNAFNCCLRAEFRLRSRYGTKALPRRNARRMTTCRHRTPWMTKVSDWIAVGFVAASLAFRPRSVANLE